MSFSAGDDRASDGAFAFGAPRESVHASCENNSLAAGTEQDSLVGTASLDTDDDTLPITVTRSIAPAACAAAFPNATFRSWLDCAAHGVSRASALGERERAPCPVLVYVPRVPSAMYDDVVCEALRERPDGDLHVASDVMSGYHLDVPLIEALRAHRCSIAALPATDDDFARLEGRHDSWLSAMRRPRRSAVSPPIVGFIPLLSQTAVMVARAEHRRARAVGAVQSSRGNESVIGDASPHRPMINHESVVAFVATHDRREPRSALTRRNRWFVFVPTFLRPPVEWRFLARHLSVNAVVNEVALWAVNPKMKKRGTLVHPPLRFDARRRCWRHAVIPKVDWARRAPVSPFDGSIASASLRLRANASLVASATESLASIFGNRPTTLYFTGRAQTVEREKLLFLARHVAAHQAAALEPHPFSFSFVREHGSGAVRRYGDDMRRSLLCVDTTGDDLTTRRITSAVLAGCIPLLLCDSCVFPFSKLFPYAIAAAGYNDVVRQLADDGGAGGDHPIFYVRLSQQLLLSHPLALLREVRRIASDASLIARLQRNLARVQRLFLSPLEPASLMVDALLEDIRASLAPPFAQSSVPDRFACPF